MSLRLPPGRLQRNVDTSVDQPRSSPVSSRLDQTKAPSGSGTSSATFNKQLSSKRPSQHASHSPLTVMTAEAGLAGSSASPSPFNSNSFDQPPMSDVRSTSACSAHSTEPVADMTTSSNPASTDSSRASPAVRSIGTVNRQSNAQATPIIVGEDVEMEVDTPPMSKRPLPRLRARSLTQIEPALKPTPESEVRVRPASSLPEDQSAFLDSIIKSLLNPSKFGRGIVFNEDAFKSALPKIEVIVQKVYTSSMYGGDIEERLKAVEPALQVLFEPIFKAPKPSGSSGDDRPQEMVFQAQERLGRQHESRNTTATPSARQAASDQTLPVNRSDPLAATLHQEGTVPSTPNDIAAASFLQVPAPQRTQQDMPVLPAASGSSPVGLSASRPLRPFSAQSHGAQPTTAGPSIAPASPVPPSTVQSSNAQLNTTQPSNLSQLTKAVPIDATTQELVQSTTPTTSPRSATSHPSISRPNTPASVGQPSPYYAVPSASNRPSGILSGSMPAQALNGFARPGAVAFGRSSPLAVPAGKSATPGRSVAAMFPQTGLPRSSPLASPLVGSTQTTQVDTRLVRDPTSAAPRASQPGPVVVPLVIPPHPMNISSSPAVVPAQELTSMASQSYPRHPHRPTLEDVIPLTGDSPDSEPEELEVWGSTRAAFYYAWIG